MGYLNLSITMDTSSYKNLVEISVPVAVVLLLIYLLEARKLKSFCDKLEAHNSQTLSSLIQQHNAFFRELQQTLENVSESAKLVEETTKLYKNDSNQVKEQARQNDAKEEEIVSCSKQMDTVVQQIAVHASKTNETKERMATHMKQMSIHNGNMDKMAEIADRRLASMVENAQQMNEGSRVIEDECKRLIASVKNLDQSTVLLRETLRQMAETSRALNPNPNIVADHLEDLKKGSNEDINNFERDANHFVSNIQHTTNIPEKAVQHARTGIEALLTQARAFNGSSSSALVGTTPVSREGSKIQFPELVPCAWWDAKGIKSEKFSADMDAFMISRNNASLQELKHEFAAFLAASASKTIQNCSLEEFRSVLNQLERILDAVSFPMAQLPAPSRLR